MTEMNSEVAPTSTRWRWLEPAPRSEMGESRLTTLHQPSVSPDARGCPSAVRRSDSSAVTEARSGANQVLVSNLTSLFC